MTYLMSQFDKSLPYPFMRFPKPDVMKHASNSLLRDDSQCYQTMDIQIQQTLNLKL